MASEKSGRAIALNAGSKKTDSGRAPAMMRKRWTMPVQFHDFAPPVEDFRDALLAGLAQAPKRLPSRFIYDERGSHLFEAILEVPEYYIPRVEIALLRAHGAEIARLAGPRAYVVDYGSGSGRKARLLLDALREPAVYAPIDISREHLLAAAEALAVDYPGLEVHATCADFLRPFTLPAARAAAVGKRIGFFPGSTIGNITLEQRAQFLAAARAMLGGGGFIVGVDLKKDTALLRAAYNDAAGASAAFNTNILVRANRELGADFDLAAFRHRAEYDAGHGRMEIGIESLRPQTVHLGAAAFKFDAGEVISTQYAYKFTTEEFAAVAAAAGFDPRPVWTDADRMFAIYFLAA
jgi:dimethylhistidine N-methyltransferase